MQIIGTVNYKLKTKNSRLRAGQILIFPLLFLVVVMILALSMFSRVAGFVRFGGRSVEHEMAVSLAEAGVDYAVFKLNTTSGYNGNPEIALGLGAFEIDIDDVGSNKKITAEGCLPTCTNARTKRTVKVEVGPASTIVNFPYVWQAGGGSGDKDHGIEESSDPNWHVYGDVRSNSFIQGVGSTIHGNAWAVGEILPAVEGGTKTAPGAPSEPLPTFDDDYWKREAAKGTNYPGELILQGINSLGPAKINGDFDLQRDELDRCELTVTGTIYVTGDISTSARCTIRLDDAFGPVGTVILTDNPSGGIKLPSESKTYKNSSNGYLLFASINSGILLDVGANGRIEALFYSPNAGVRISDVTSTTIMEGVIAANKITLDPGGTFTFNKAVNTPLASFIPSPGSGGWQIRRGTYKISQ